MNEWPNSPASLGVDEFMKLTTLAAETRLLILNDVLQSLPDWMRKAVEQETGSRAFAYITCQDTKSMQLPHRSPEECDKTHGPLSHSLWQRALDEFMPMRQELVGLRDDLRKPLDDRHSPA